MKPTLGKDAPINVQAIVESKLLIQANSGGGKSWAVRRVLEQTYSSVPQIVIDPEGEFHTLREKHEYALLGQKGGDGPADLKSAAMLARRILELNVSAIVDIYELGTRRQAFVKLFCEALINAPRDLWHPVLIVLDEANVFCPESGQANAESTNAVIDLMTRGRKRGFGVVLATQRIASLHKSAAAECNSKMIGRTALDVDMKRAAKELGFTTKEQEMSLRTLKPGTFFVYGPALASSVRLITVGPVITTHPRAGERATAPTPPGPKVRKILGQLADLPKEAEAEAKTIAEMRLEVHGLKKQLAAAPKTAVETKTIERSVIKPADLDRLVKLGDKLWSTVKPLCDGLALVTQRAIPEKMLVPPPRPPSPPRPSSIPRRGDGVMGNERRARFEQRAIERSSIAKGPSKFLEALIQYPDGLDDSALAIMTGYKATSRREYIRQLIERGYAERSHDNFRATAAGITAMPNAQPLPTGSALRAWHATRIGKGLNEILSVAIECFPNLVDDMTIHDRTGYKATSIREYKRQLTARRLVTLEHGSIRASDKLFD